MKKIVILTILVLGIMLTGCTKESSLNSSGNDKKQFSLGAKEAPPKELINLVPTEKISENPRYCQKDNDCTAITNPSNGCYFSAFNKYAQEAIEEFKNNPIAGSQDCPKFNSVVCEEGECKIKYDYMIKR